jgi:N-acyl amino acid synthase of PEP-CTERM/exosortase system
MENYTLPLADNFEQYFQIELATSERQRQAVSRIRYRVYCQELGLEPADQFPDGMESDEYDLNALMCLVIHKRSGEPAGCVRMVMAGENCKMPFEPHCHDSLNIEFADLLYGERDSVVECSRLAVDRRFRRRVGEGHTRLGEYDALDCCHQEQRSFSLIGIAVVIAGLAVADLAGRPNVLAMMEPYLPRLLRRTGIRPKKAGKLVDYHGRRAPYFLNINTALPSMRPDLRALFDTLKIRLNEHFDIAKVNAA